MNSRIRSMQRRIERLEAIHVDGSEALRRPERSLSPESRIWMALVMVKAALRFLSGERL